MPFPGKSTERQCRCTCKSFCLIRRGLWLGGTGFALKRLCSRRRRCRRSAGAQNQNPAKIQTPREPTPPTRLQKIFGDHSSTRPLLIQLTKFPISEGHILRLQNLYAQLPGAGRYQDRISRNPIERNRHEYQDKAQNCPCRNHRRVGGGDVCFHHISLVQVAGRWMLGLIRYRRHRGGDEYRQSQTTRPWKLAVRHPASGSAQAKTASPDVELCQGQ